MNADAHDLSVRAGDEIASHPHSPERLRAVPRASAESFALLEDSFASSVAR